MTDKIKKIPKSFFIPTILTLSIICLGIRIILSALPSFEVDMNAWIAWAYRMRELGPAGFYSDNVWTQYTPGFLYWLWGLGQSGLISELSIKLSVVAADLLTGLIIWKIIKPKNEKLAYLSFFLYVLNPIVIFTGSVWGQIDGIVTLFMVLSTYFILEKKNLYLSGLSFALAFLIKPQAFVILPGIAFVLYANRCKLREWFNFGASALTTVLLASAGFFPNDPIFGIFKLVEKMTGYYNYTSVFAFNIWAIAPGMWKTDSGTLLGISFQNWGIGMFILALGAIFIFFRNKIHDKHIQYLVFALSILASFLFPTRVHERYLFPFFAFMLVSAGLSKSKYLNLAYIFLSILNFLNLYHPYAYYSDNFLRSETFLKITGDLAKPVAFLSLLIFFGILVYKKLDKRLIIFFEKYKPGRSLSVKDFKETLPTIKISKSTTKYLLLLVLSFAFFVRVYSLANPKNEYFDEVYHAFTARRMLHGDPKAWEWWNTPPQGFAYEWTHPPLAKFGMVLGMTLIGENSFGWRFPGAMLGVVSVYLIYLIAKEIFKDELVGVIAAGIFSLDGLTLVISRIGMNDVYFLTFALASLYFFLKGRPYGNFLSALFYGLSISSKWSALWLIPVIMAAHFVFAKKFKWSYLWFLILPPLIYVGTYLPFFMSDHTFAQFFNVNVITKCFGRNPCDLSFGVQQQMWWYHTNLKATHSYTSPWWSWPLMIRPVYLYTSETLRGLVARIYLIGNPFVFWLGVVSVAATAYFASIKRNKTLLFVVFSYLIFFVPWALSPRIMFLYHYLPSIPFMAIALAYVLRKFPRIIIPTFLLLLVAFIYFYPHWAGLWVSEKLDTSYYWFTSWR